MNCFNLYDLAAKTVEQEVEPPLNLPEPYSGHQYLAQATHRLINRVRYVALSRLFEKTPAALPEFEMLERILSSKDLLSIEHTKKIDSLAEKIAKWYKTNCEILQYFDTIARREHSHQLSLLRKRIHQRSTINPVHDSNVIDYALQAYEITKSGLFDCAVSLLWKGAPYAYLFEMHGFPTYHCKVIGQRPKRKFKLDDADIEGKRVLIVEDDFKTGNTLRKAIDYLNRFQPESLSVYLGSMRKGGIVEVIDFPEFFSEFKQVILGPNREEEVACENDSIRLKAAREAIEPLLRPHYK